MPFVVEDSLTTYLRSWSRLLPCAEAGSSFSNVNENLRNKAPITITPNHPRHIPNLLQPPTHTLPNQNVHHKTKKDPHPCESGHLRTFRRNLPVVHGLQFEHGPLIGSKHQQKIVSMMTMMMIFVILQQGQRCSKSGPGRTHPHNEDRSVQGLATTEVDGGPTGPTRCSGFELIKES